MSETNNTENTTTSTPTTNSTTTPETQPQTSSNVIQVSTLKMPSFYVNLSKKFLSSNEEVELSGLGSAITTAVTAAENLHHHGFATIKSIQSSTVATPSYEGSNASKPKIVIVLKRSDNFNELYSKEEKEMEERKEQKASE